MSNKAKERYDKENTKTYSLKLNMRTDTDLIELLDKTENKQGTIKQALRHYIILKKFSKRS